MTMREILFRGKHSKKSMWDYGDLYIDHDKVYIGVRETMHGVRVHGEVIHETVGQFTGLTDKNGKKIFEGDIVERWYTLTRGPHKGTRKRQVGVVQYDSITCGYLLRGACNLRRQWPGDTIEVIGNIHDNPDMLEVRHG